MTDRPWTVFVEGGSDKTLLQYLMHHLGITGVALEEIGGGISKLKAIRQQIERTHDGGRRVGVIVDADADVTTSRRNLLETIERYSLPIVHSFLLPSNNEAGCLETLLERMAVAQHRGIYDCFDEYGSCVTSLHQHYNIPDAKAKIYAYCEALGIETNAKKRDYGDPTYWNLDSEALVPLKAFLGELQSD